MNRLWSNSDKAEFLGLYLAGNSSRDVVTELKKLHPDWPNYPNYRTIGKIAKKFSQTGSVSRKKYVGTSSVMTEDKRFEVLAEIVENNMQSTVKLAAKCEVSRSSVLRLLKKEGFHPYKLSKVQKLYVTDYARREEFANLSLEQIRDDKNFVNNIIFTDGAIFHVNGHVNRHNTRRWSQGNPYWFGETNVQNDERVMVFGGIWKDKVIGPYFFDSTVTGDSFTEMMDQKVLPQIKRIRGFRQSVFLLDGAPAHFSKKSREWLSRIFPDRWIGRAGQLFEWPARSPDLNPMDFFFWGYVKDITFKQAPSNLEELKKAIEYAFKTVTPEMLKKTREEWFDRLCHTIYFNGRHFEHYNL